MVYGGCDEYYVLVLGSNIIDIKIEADSNEYPIELFDKNGNRVYYQDSDGYFEKSEYDSHNKEKCFENSNGFRAKYKYELIQKP